jgi:hypothetical protein
MGGRRSVLGNGGERIGGSCADTGYTVATHCIAFRILSRRGGNLRRQPGDVLCLRPGKRKPRRALAACCQGRLRGMPRLRRRTRLRRTRLRRGRSPLRRGRRPLCRCRSLCGRPLRRPLRCRPMPVRRRGRGRLRRLWLHLLGLHGNLLDMGIHRVGLRLLMGRSRPGAVRSGLDASAGPGPFQWQAQPPWPV